MVKTIIFDFNGTLLDDCDLCLEILNILTKENNLSYVSKEEYRSIFTFPVYLYYKQLGFDVSFDSFKKIGESFHYHYNNRSYDECKLFDDVKDLLSSLKEKYRLACLSASMTTTLIKQLKHYQIFEYFDDIIGLNDSYANSKERVGIEYINTLKQGHDEVLLIGDSIHDKEVADAMNVSCILVSTGHTNKERLQQSCKIVVDNLSDIKKYL